MNELYDLPSGWEWKTFDEVSTFIRGITFKPNEKYEEPNENTVICFRTTNIQSELDDRDVMNIDLSLLKSDNKIVKNGDILISSANSLELLGKCCLVKNINYKATLGGFIVCGRANKNILDEKYFYYFFSSELNQKKMRNLANKTTGIANLPIKKVEKESIPIPPLSEQQRIVSKLDLLFQKIDKSIELHQKNMNEADAFMGSVLNEVFDRHSVLDTESTNDQWIPNQVRDDEKWAKNVLLKDITSKIGSGATPSGGQKAYKTEGISLIRSMNVHDYGFRFKNLAFIDDIQAKKLSNVTVEANDVLLNITGASVARCCIVDESILPARVNQHVSIIRLKNDMLPKFLHYYLISPSIKSDLLFSSSGGATREAITKSMIEGFTIPLPPLPIQQKVVQYLDSVSEKTEMLKRVQHDKMESLKALKASILDRAFRGEL